jgi:uncharacterized membrane protein
MRGPFLPIYGSGAIMMLVVSMPFQDNIGLTYLAGCVGATALEYVTGVAMEALFKVRYWDYSKKKFNFQGHICLGSTIAWGFFTIIMTEVVHVRVEIFVFSIPYQVLTIVTLVLTALIFSDFALSFKAAIDLRNVLVKMEQAKEEMVRIQRRLDVIIALTNEGMENRREGFAESVSGFKTNLGNRLESVPELRSSIEGKLESVKDALRNKPAGYMENVREELSELKTRYTVSVEKRASVSSLRDFFQRDLIRANPSMTSVKFKEALEELKQKTAGKKAE